MSNEPQNEPKPAPTFADVAKTFAPGEDPYIRIPLPDGGEMLFKKFVRYGEMEAFTRERKRSAMRAVGGDVPEVKGIEGLTNDEAVAIYTIHKLAVSPEVPLTEESARLIVENPFFSKYVTEWLQATGFAAAEAAFRAAISEGKG